MAKIIGRREAVGIGLEATRGVGVAATYLLPKTDFSFEDKANKARSGEGFGHISGEGSQAIVTGKFSEGSMSAEVGAKYFPVILSTVIGSISSASEGSDYKHTLSLDNDNTHPTMSVHLDNPNQDLIFERVMCDSFELTIDQESVVSFSAGVIGKASATTSFDSTSLLSSDYKFVGRDTEFKIADDIASLGAASAISLKSLTLTINKNAEQDWVLGTLEPEDGLNKQITIQGSVTLNFEDKTYADYMLNGDTKAIGIKLTNTREDCTGGESPEFYLELPVCDFSEWEPAKGNDDIMTQTINFTALYDMDNSRLISDCYVINDVASY